MDGNIWYTLVVEASNQFFVTRYNDSRALFFGKNSEIIEPADFGRYIVNNVPLSQLVAEVAFARKLELAGDALPLPGHGDSNRPNSPPPPAP